MSKRQYVDVVILNTKESEITPLTFYRTTRGVRKGDYFYDNA